LSLITLDTFAEKYEAKYDKAVTCLTNRSSTESVVIWFDWGRLVQSDQWLRAPGR